MPVVLDHLLVNERGIAFDPASGEMYRLIGPAYALVRLLQRGAAKEELLRYLLEEYEIDETTARRDLDAFFQMLEKLKLWGSAS
ncbi:MAG TPA: HPr-rel-A system PqqD family peptide chaperone [Candidatus Methylacidiphilales bacterium]|jgi:PqqD family protein of HPr-rel-A system|nr:HPr-rel-A system PqqD family peptide chaperone [Candidatus Methylacidiphilales bacterium]